MVALPFLLDGLALQWFRQNKSSWPTWAHFRAAFRARFGDINYQWRLDEQVAGRVQGEDELTADYQTHLVSSQNSGGSSVLNYNLTQLHSP